MGNSQAKPEKGRSLSLGSFPGVAKVLGSMDEKRLFPWKTDRKGSRSSEVGFSLFADFRNLHAWLCQSIATSALSVTVLPQNSRVLNVGLQIYVRAIGFAWLVVTPLGEIQTKSDISASQRARISALWNHVHGIQVGCWKLQFDRLLGLWAKGLERICLGIFLLSMRYVGNLHPVRFRGQWTHRISIAVEIWSKQHRWSWWCWYLVGNLSCQIFIRRIGGWCKTG